MQALLISGMRRGLLVEGMALRSQVVPLRSRLSHPIGRCLWLLGSGGWGAARCLR